MLASMLHHRHASPMHVTLASSYESVPLPFFFYLEVSMGMRLDSMEMS